MPRSNRLPAADSASRSATGPSPPQGPVSGPAKDRRITPDDSLTARRRHDIGEHIRQFPVEHPADGLIFTNEDGHALRRTTFSREIWRPAVKKARAPKRIGMHELRHYYASLLIRHGESVKTVQRRLGHATAAETLDTYSHLWPDSDDRTREAIDAVLSPGVPQACPSEQPG